MHPLSTVVPDDLGLYIDQVVRLVKNTGSTYASSDLIFGVSEDERLDLEYEADDDEEPTEIEPHDEDESEDDEDSEDDDFEDFEIDDDDEEDEGWRKGGTGFSP
jgi:hypothetical protein